MLTLVPFGNRTKAIDEGLHSLGEIVRVIMSKVGSGELFGELRSSNGCVGWDAELSGGVVQSLLKDEALGLFGRCGDELVDLKQFAGGVCMREAIEDNSRTTIVGGRRLFGSSGLTVRCFFPCFSVRLLMAPI